MGNRAPKLSKEEKSSHKVHNVLRFDPKQSYAICIGMDRLQLEGMPEHSLGPLVASDCKAMVKAFSDFLGIPSAQVKQLVASEDPRRLFTRDGLLAQFVDWARYVGEQGSLVITFSGHGTTVVKDGTEQAVLPVIGHTTESPECLDCKDITQSVQTEAKFRGKNVLLVLDCCFSGGIAEWLQCNEGADEVFRTIATCFPKQTCGQLDPLENSKFVYFLIDALRRRQEIIYGTESCQVQQEGSSGPTVCLCLQDIAAHICVSSRALSALYVKYDIASHSIPGCRLQQSSEGNMLDGVDSTDDSGSEGSGRLSFFLKYWSVFLMEEKASKQRLPLNSYQWLTEQAESNGPLVTLQKHGHLVGKVLQATICALSYSVASIHLYEKHPWNGRAQLFMMDFADIIGVVETAILGGEQIIVRHKAVRQALTYYFAAYKNAGRLAPSELKELSNLYRLLLVDDTEAYGPTDKPQSEVEAAAAMLSNWQPLVALDNDDEGVCPHARVQRETAHQLQPGSMK